MKLSSCVTPRRLLLLSLALALGYAVARYVVFKGVDTAHLPLYVTNKALSLAAISLLAAATFLPQQSEMKRRLFGYGFMLVFLHLFLSLLITSPAYYAKFFTDEGKMTFSAEMAMLCGALGAGIMVLLFLRQYAPLRDAAGNLTTLHAAAAAPLVFALTAGHLAFMGAAGWFAVDDWPGGLPPITMLGFIAAVAGLVGSVTNRKTSLSPRTRTPPPQHH